jgi:malate permease and related proteins
LSILLITFQAVTALLVIGIIGFWIIGRKKVTSTTLGFLSALSIDIAVPCLTLANLVIDFSPEKTPGWWHLPIWWVGFAAVALGLSLLSSFIVKKELRSEFTIGLWYQNGLFFPIIILGGLFGIQNPYLAPLFLFVFIHPTVMFSTYALFFGKKAASQPFNLRRLINPVLVTTIVGLTVALLGFKAYVPDFIRTVLIMVGAMASPLFMLILGGTIYHDLKGEGVTRGKVYTGELIKFVLVKNFLFPLVFLGLLILIHPDYTIALIIILEAAVPPVTAIPIFAERSGGNRAFASQSILASFVVSIISIPVIILLFSQFFPFPIR